MHVSSPTSREPAAPAPLFSSGWFGWSVILLVCLLAAACTSEVPQQQPEKPPAVTLSFTQLRIDEGTPRAQLRVVNHENTDIAVTGLGLEWSGYGGRFRDDYDTTIRPEQTLDLRIVLPPPVCSKGSGPAYGLLEVGDTKLRARLDASGQGFVERIWERACAEQYISDRVAIGYGDTWRRTGTGSSSTLLGSVQLSRRGTDENIALRDISGSVLFDLRLPRPVVLASSSDSDEYPLRLLPTRCDEHALSESSQTFGFRALLEFGDSKPVTTIVEPNLRTQQKALALLRRACR